MFGNGGLRRGSRPSFPDSRLRLCRARLGSFGKNRLLRRSRPSFPNHRLILRLGSSSKSRRIAGPLSRMHRNRTSRRGLSDEGRRGRLGRYRLMHGLIIVQLPGVLP